MDFQGFVNTFSLPCCVLSVQKKSDGSCGEIRIVKANDYYKHEMGIARYHDSMLYQELVPKDAKFEDFCYRAAVLKQKMHAYVDTKGLNAWTDQTMLPLAIDENDLSYCAFYFKFTRYADADLMSQVSIDTASFVIKSCITLRGAEDFNQSMSEVIEDLQKKIDSFSCVILVPDHLHKTYSVLCEKYRNDSARFADYADMLPYEIVKSWEKTIGVSNSIIVKDKNDMKLLEAKNPKWVKSLKMAKVENLILYPLLQHKKHIAYLFCTNFDTENLVEIKELVELLAFFLSSEITNHTVVQKLEHLGTVDLLTGVKNRNAMNQRVDLAVSKEKPIPVPYGVVFADLNGLKQMNDENGHDSGDVLLKNAAKLLKQVFPNGEIYRSGGDEFLILQTACTEADFNAKVSELRQKSAYGNEVCFAIGSKWEEENKKLRAAMHIADENMYLDKENFYKLHPNEERRRR